jgi:hypothetical protein
MLGSVAREALAVMAGLWWDLGVDAARLAEGPRANANRMKRASSTVL